MTINVVHHVEITMALPNMICLVVRDAECAPVSLFGPLAEARPEARLDVVTADRETGGPGTDEAILVGAKDADRKYLHFLGAAPIAFLDRTAVDNPANWPVIGGCAVVAVYRKSRPYSQTTYNDSGYEGSRWASMEHEIYLELDADLPQGGPYNISVAGDTFPATTFTFDDKVTRAIGLRSTQLGYRPEDDRKIAEFILWIPKYGFEGEVSLPAGLDTAQIIDAYGAVALDGIPITLRHDATTALAGMLNMDAASSTIPPKSPSSVTAGNPTTLTFAAPHGWSTGDIKYLIGYSFTPSSVSIIGFYTITVTGANTITIPANTTGAVYTKGVFPAEFDSLVFETRKINWWGTNRYEMDGSALKPLTYQGQYRFRIPGLGVSDPFYIDDVARLRLFAGLAKGFYRQLTGIELDAAYNGYPRPCDFADGANGQEIFESLLPAVFTNEADAPCFTGTRINSNLVSSVYGTAVTVPWVGPTARDAGDWDWHLLRHVAVAYQLLEYGWRQMPEAQRDLIQTGFPKATTFCDPVLYAGTEVLGDQFHMAVAEIDAIRRFQKPGGGCYSGMQFSVSGLGGSMVEPSWISIENALLQAPDPFSSLFYVISAAKLAQVAEEAGFPALSAVWLDSAVLEWEWQETIFQDYLANGPTGAEVTACFGAFAALAGWDYDPGKGIGGVATTTAPVGITTYWARVVSTTTFTLHPTSADAVANTNVVDVTSFAGPCYAFIVDTAYYHLAIGGAAKTITAADLGTNVLTTAAAHSFGAVTPSAVRIFVGELAANIADVFDTTYLSYRRWAEATLYHVTDDLVLYGHEVAGGDMNSSGATGNAGWEFTQAPSAVVAYPSLVETLNNGHGNLALISEHRPPQDYWWYALSPTKSFDQDNQAIKTLQWMADLRSGGNHCGLCWTVGFGARSPKNVLTRDREAAGIPGSALVGSQVTYNHNRSSQAILAFANFGIGDSILNYTLAVPPTGGTQRKKLVEPMTGHTPVYEAFWDNSWVIFCTEFVMQGNIIPPAVEQLMLHFVGGGNEATEAPLKRVRRSVVVTE